jgi:hypothetical protein
MKTYFFNPSGDLIVYDSEEESILILERINKVKVFSGGDIRMGDFDGVRGGEEIDGTKVGTRKPRACKSCGETGHRRDTCPNKDNPEQ